MSDSCWYLTPNKKKPTLSDASIHKGHMKDNNDHLHFGSVSCLNEDAMKTITSLHQSGQNPTTIAEAITALYGDNRLVFTRSQVAHIITTRNLELECHDFDSLSSAEQLLHKLQKYAENDNLHYVAMIHNVEDGYKIRLPHGRPTKAAEGLEQSSITQIRKSMRIHDNQDVLLAVAWCSEYERQMVKKFPELITFDVTEKTNNQKRGLFVGTGLDGNGQIFPCLHVFMPNSQSSSYGWIYSEAIPLLWGIDTIQNIEAIGTDGEYALYSPLHNLVEMGDCWAGTLIYR
jgi:hypothetical protein